MRQAWKSGVGEYKVTLGAEAALPAPPWGQGHLAASVCSSEEWQGDHEHSKPPRARVSSELSTGGVSTMGEGVPHPILVPGPPAVVTSPCPAGLHSVRPLRGSGLTPGRCGAGPSCRLGDPLLVPLLPGPASVQEPGHPSLGLGSQSVGSLHAARGHSGILSRWGGPRPNVSFPSRGAPTGPQTSHRG